MCPCVCVRADTTVTLADDGEPTDLSPNFFFFLPFFICCPYMPTFFFSFYIISTRSRCMNILCIHPQVPRWGKLPRPFLEARARPFRDAAAAVTPSCRGPPGDPSRALRYVLVLHRALRWKLAFWSCLWTTTFHALSFFLASFFSMLLFPLPADCCCSILLMVCKPGHWYRDISLVLS